MWNFRKNNLIINDSDNFFVHKVHLERLLHTKTHIKNKGPELPFFIKNKLSLKEALRSKERKRCYENTILFSRLLEIDNSMSNYSRYNKPVYCPAFDKLRYNFTKKEKAKNTKRQNKVIFTRLLKQKSHYPTNLFLNLNNYINHIRENIKRQRNDNPNINYATFDQFKQNIINKRYSLKKSYSTEYYEPMYLNNKRNIYNYDTDIILRNNKADKGFPSAKSNKDNNIGTLSTMVTVRPGKSMSRCQSSFNKRQKKF